MLCDLQMPSEPCVELQGKLSSCQSAECQETGDIHIIHTSTINMYITQSPHIVWGSFTKNTLYKLTVITAI